MRLDDDILKTIVYLGREDHGSFVPYGTGFITARLPNEHQAWQTLVTARHVIDSIKAKTVYVRLNNRAGEAQTIRVAKDEWHFHPDDRVDVAVCPSIIGADVFDILHFALGPHSAPGIPDHSLSPDLIKKHRVGIGDEAYIAGMFVGRMGNKRNIPIVRQGTIAAMPDEPMETSYGFHEAFLLESLSIHGLSGSPVCLNMPLNRRMSSTYLMNGPLPLPGDAPLPFYVMGMVLGYNEVYGPTDKINLATPTKSGRQRRVNVALNTGIAVVLPIWKVIEAIDEPSIQSQRDASRTRRSFVATSSSSLQLPRRSARS
jgi:hypothetical protein